MLDLVLPAPRLPGRSAHARTSAAVTVALHAAAAAAIATLALGDAHRDRAQDARLAAAEAVQAPRMIFLQMPGPGGGGGGGGNRQPSPPSRAQNVGADLITVPVARPVRVEPNPIEAMPSQLVVLPSVPLASGSVIKAVCWMRGRRSRFRRGLAWAEEWVPVRERGSGPAKGPASAPVLVVGSAVASISRATA